MISCIIDLKSRCLATYVFFNVLMNLFSNYNFVSKIDLHICLYLRKQHFLLWQNFTTWQPKQIFCEGLLGIKENSLGINDEQLNYNYPKE